MNLHEISQLQSLTPDAQYIVRLFEQLSLDERSYLIRLAAELASQRQQERLRTNVIPFPR